MMVVQTEPKELITASALAVIFVVVVAIVI